ncbi:hypothetical protein F4556_007160 [Kitasatospora gansuensis]|uniref:Uncharacterized protein n=1 Tax=Kitasatospora gansuensis TaxID=258050 RepID=A0A7W7SJI6_9ACTN|nr:hypothetical protein [Kitasatospora gansuensis]MBB4951625.1 hypothetical protein [Kitasatospora gansuensis]
MLGRLDRSTVLVGTNGTARRILAWDVDLGTLHRVTELPESMSLSLGPVGRA